MPWTYDSLIYTEAGTWFIEHPDGEFAPNAFDNLRAVVSFVEHLYSQGAVLVEVGADPAISNQEHLQDGWADTLRITLPKHPFKRDVLWFDIAETKADEMKWDQEDKIILWWD